MWIELYGEAFPEAGWNDMSVAFAGDLVEVLSSIVEGKEYSHRIRFYDGPYWITVGRSDSGEFVVKQGEGDREKGQVQFPVEAVMKGVRSTASALLGACRTRQWGDNSDVVRLARALELLDWQDDRVG
ncbi:hypothetical protein ACWC2T_45110 [Streptomyces sp. NPDC001393]